MTDKNILEERLEELSRENKLLKELQNTSSANKEVVIRHSGAGPQIMFNNGTEIVPLSGNPPENMTTVPYDVYLRAVKNTPWFRLGYLYADDSDMDNPNLILDVKGWLENLQESEIKEAVEEIDSEGTLHKLYAYTTLRRDNAAEGKTLILRKTVAERLSKLLNVDVVEE